MSGGRDPGPLHPFDDIIDGYFPLAVSLAQMLERRGIASAYVELTHAPIMQIPGLPHDAPVPLNIQAGRAGVIDRLYLRVDAGAVSGGGIWRWLDGSLHGDKLDPMTRLAEPAFLRGFCSAPSDKAAYPIAKLITGAAPEGIPFWGPFETKPPHQIRYDSVAPDLRSQTTEFLILGA